jgi:mRNA-degrading endonuclease RelE of RelBE toxin-antitoxin system
MNYEVIYLPEFKEQAKKVGLTAEDARLIEIEIMENPDAYPVMAGTGGLRKMRFAPEKSSGGKSGGVRVCYFIIVDAAHIYMVTVFGKNDKANLDPADRNEIARIIAATKRRYKT